MLERSSRGVWSHLCCRTFSTFPGLLESVEIVEGLLSPNLPPHGPPAEHSVSCVVYGKSSMSLDVYYC